MVKDMEYREIGKTGCKAGIIGLGCEHLDGKPYEQVKETIDAALENGVNLMDVFMPGQEVRGYIAKALAGRREQVMLQGHIGSTDINQQYDISRDLPTVRRYFEELLRHFGYIDFGMMFFIDSEDDYKGVFETGFADYVLKLKQQGDIRHIGFSSHAPKTAMRVIETGLPEMMLFSINPAFDLYPADVHVLNDSPDTAAFQGMDPTRAALYKLCAQKGVGITVMKTLGAGKLISPEHTPFGRPMTVPQCIHYALSRPAVASVMLGCKNAAEVQEAVRYLETSEEERDYAQVLGTLKSDFRGNCVYCSHCQPCPAGIDIAAVNKYLDIARLDEANVPPSIRSHYAGLARHGGDCIACGSCEARCPFGVKVIENMADARRVFEK
jgi:predicted aldo/keto reductase-like oxidoreductase